MSFRTTEPHIKLPGDNGTIVWPFSPPIYQTEITDQERELLLSQGAECEQDYQAKLAGNMYKGGSFSYLPQHIDHWEPILMERVHMFMAGMKYAFGKDYNTQKLLEYNRPTREDRNNREVGKLKLESLWINYQREGDYNPPHIHSGALSMVIYLDVPDKIFQKQAPSNTAHAGDIVFYYGERISDYQNAEWPTRPYNNLMFIFPAGLRHAVPPFFETACRVSVSGNWTVVPS